MAWCMCSGPPAIMYVYGCVYICICMYMQCLQMIAWCMRLPSCPCVCMYVYMYMQIFIYHLWVYSHAEKQSVLSVFAAFACVCMQMFTTYHEVNGWNEGGSRGAFGLGCPPSCLCLCICVYVCVYANVYRPCAIRPWRCFFLQCVRACKCLLHVCACAQMLITVDGMWGIA
jgi:hypothetical protein